MLQSGPLVKVGAAVCAAVTDRWRRGLAARGGGGPAWGLARYESVLSLRGALRLGCVFGRRLSAAVPFVESCFLLSPFRNRRFLWRWALRTGWREPVLVKRADSGGAVLALCRRLQCWFTAILQTCYHIINAFRYRVTVTGMNQTEGSERLVVLALISQLFMVILQRAKCTLEQDSELLD